LAIHLQPCTSRAKGQGDALAKLASEACSELWRPGQGRMSMTQPRQVLLAGLDPARLLLRNMPGQASDQFGFSDALLCHGLVQAHVAAEVIAGDLHCAGDCDGSCKNVPSARKTSSQPPS
jgi:hypothetical protein